MEKRIITESMIRNAESRHENCVRHMNVTRCVMHACMVAEFSLFTLIIVLLSLYYPNAAGMSVVLLVFTVSVHVYAWVSHDEHIRNFEESLDELDSLLEDAGVTRQSYGRQD